MNYLIHITEKVKHSSLPEWALHAKAEISALYGDYPVSSGERESVLRTIDGIIDKLQVKTRNSISPGTIITTLIEDDKMTIYSITGKTPYFEISFKPTKRDKIIDPFSI